MTVLRLADRQLLIHSPTPLVPSLQAAIADIGTVAWIIGPNRLHYWWIPQWHRAYPAAQVWLAPRIREQAGGHIDFPTVELDEGGPRPWDEEIATLSLNGSYMTEIVFFHKATRTLILTDLIENFEPRKLGVWERLLAKLGGVLDPDGTTPRDMRLTYQQRKPELQQAARIMIEWTPSRIIIAHGRWYETHAEAELRRALRWVFG
jgi:hypothetical protein